MLYKNVTSSILRYCSEFADEHPGIEVINFDAHGDEATLPQSDVMGPSALTVNVSGSFCIVSLLLGVSTREDTNLFRLSSLIDSLFEDMLPESYLPLYNAETGQAIGRLVVEDGSRVLPVDNTSTRALQFVMVNLRSTQTFS